MGIHAHRGIAWMDDGTCATADPEAWFPEKGGNPRPAIRVCRNCPVRSDCREYALERPELRGIWGGLTEPERQRLRVAAGQEAA